MRSIRNPLRERSGKELDLAQGNCNTNDEDGIAPSQNPWQSLFLDPHNPRASPRSKLNMLVPMLHNST
jgi:hypothetical protein